MKFIGAVLVAASLAVPCSASEVTYLICDLPAMSQDEVPVRYEVTLDEGRGVASWVVKENRTASQAKAFFTRDTVTWTDPELLPITDLSFALSRMDLSFTVDVSVGGKTMAHKVGKCSLDDRARKF